MEMEMDMEMGTGVCADETIAGKRGGLGGQGNKENRGGVGFVLFPSAVPPVPVV